MIVSSVLIQSLDFGATLGFQPSSSVLTHHHHFVLIPILNRICFMSSVAPSHFPCHMPLIYFAALFLSPSYLLTFTDVPNLQPLGDASIDGYSLGGSTNWCLRALRSLQGAKGRQIICSSRLDCRDGFRYRKIPTVKYVG